MPRSTRTTLTLAADAITVEGALIPPAMLGRVASQQADGQSAEDYRVPKGLTLRDEIARYFRIGQALFTDLRAGSLPSAGKTIAFVEALLRDVFGFADLVRVSTPTLDGQLFTPTLEGLSGRVPIVVVPPSDELDHPSEHLTSEHRRRSAASALQDWLNANEKALWGICCNGDRLRLVRDNASLTRPSYIEADLRHIFENETFADFTTLWLLLHSSRFGVPGTVSSDSYLEHWREAGQREGVTARERLRDGVKAALQTFGTGFLAHEKNGALRERVRTGTLPLPEFFGQLLHLVYRLIFLLTAEDRGLLHMPGASVQARKLYANGYSIGLLRDRAVRRAAWDRHHDRWEGLLITFSALARGEPQLGLPALDGLFAAGGISDIEAAHLSNRALMQGIYRLAWLKEDSSLFQVNWRDMETEELGSVYESLLELTPRLTDDGHALGFAEGGETKGHARKTTGSYYTPDALVQALLNSALDPVLDHAEAEANDPAQALLGVTVIDPACGSGHFLLAAARRIATRLAKARTGGVASAGDFRHALRDVVRSCIHGVDRNPMAVELTKVALWIDTVEPGKPLGFLDGSIRCGDSLLGIYDLSMLAKGVPDAAYKPLTGDDKETPKHFEKQNKAEREGQGSLNFTEGGGKFPPIAPLVGEAKAVRALPEDSPLEIALKRARFQASRSAPGQHALRVAADLYIAAFMMPKAGGATQNRGSTIPTTANIWQSAAGHVPDGPPGGLPEKFADAARAFHWPLEFPDVMDAGGFDVVLGNPPWEVLQLGEEEYFASRLPEIAELAGAARKRAIAALATDRPSIFAEYQAEKRRFEAGNEFVRASGRFDLTARGKINTYALFSELFASLASPRGCAGVIVPTGIATDATTAEFFSNLLTGKRLARLIDFENREAIFPGVHRSFKFSLLTIVRDRKEVSFAFFLTDPAQLSEPERCFSLTAEEIARINPNTRTAPILRSRTDAELIKRIHTRTPVLFADADLKDGNPWGVTVATRLWNMAEDAAWFRTGVQLQEEGFVRQGTDWNLTQFSDASVSAKDTVKRGHQSNPVLNSPLQRYRPLYEAKMIHQFDHRWATYEGAESRECTLVEKVNPEFEPTARYWVPKDEIIERLKATEWKSSWLLGWRNITNSTNERTNIFSVMPLTAVGHTSALLFVRAGVRLTAALLGNLNSLILDFVARLKVGGTHLTYAYLKQYPVLAPSAYSNAALAFIIPRVLELTYTSYSIAEFARDLGYEGPPFTWDEGRRARLRAELDSWYARAYGLTRDELRYILDPADVMGPSYPSETFRVLKKNEIARFGEYRTAKLVLAAWDRIPAEIPDVSAPIAAAPSTSAPRPIDLAMLPDGAWSNTNAGPDATLAQLAALVNALPGPTAISRVRLAALYALEPRYLTPHLSGAERATWRRLIGPAADPFTGTNVAAFAPTIDAAWGKAVSQLRGMKAISENTQSQTWAAGPKLNQSDFDPAEWTHGRATFVFRALEQITPDDATSTLPAEDQVWVNAA